MPDLLFSLVQHYVTQDLYIKTLINLSFKLPIPMKKISGYLLG